MNRIKNLLLSIAILSSCQESKKGVEFQEIVIDVDHPKALYFSSMVDTCYFIPLDSKAIIGEIGWLQITDQTIAVLDPSVSKSIYLFNRAGELKTTIKNVGEGPGQYLMPRYLNLLEDSNQLVLYDDAGPKILTYSMEGQLEEELSISELGQLDDLKFTHRGYWILKRSGALSQGNAVDFLNSDFSKSSFSFPTVDLEGWESGYGRQHAFIPAVTQSQQYFQLNSTSDLLHLSTTGLLNHYRFRFSNRGLDYSDLNINPTDYLSVSQARDLVYLGPNHVDAGNYMILDINDAGYGSLAVFDKVNNKAFKISKIVNDLSLMMNISGITGGMNNQAGYLSLSMPYGMFASVREQLDTSDNLYHEVIQAVSSDDPESFVLMIYKLKEDLPLEN